MRKLGIILSLMLGLVMLVIGGGSALADGDEENVDVTPAPEAEIYQGMCGTVSGIDIDNGILILETSNLGEVRVKLGDSTIYRFPGQEDATVADIKEGGRLAVLVTVNEEGEYKYTAVRVMIVPSAAIRKHVSGIVVSVKDRIMTIINASGEEITIKLPEGVKGGEVGEFVVVSVRKSSGKDELIATGVQTAAEVQTRLQNRLNSLASEQTANQVEVQTRQRTMLELQEKLERLVLRHREVLQRVLGKAPEAAKDGISKAITNCDRQMERVRQMMQERAQNQPGVQIPSSGGVGKGTTSTTVVNGGQGRSQQGK